MSHLTTFKNNALKNCEREMLEESLKEMGITLEYNSTIKSSYTRETNVDAAVIYNGEKVPVGLNFKKDEKGDENIEVIGDYFGIDLVEEEFVDRIAKFYSKNETLKIIEENSWNVEDITLNDNDEFEIYAYKVV